MITLKQEEFFPEYYYVMGEMGEGAKPEDVLKVMEAVKVVLHLKCV